MDQNATNRPGMRKKDLFIACESPPLFFSFGGVSVKKKRTHIILTRLSIIQTRSIQAYYFGSRRNPGRISVNVTYRFIDKGDCIPQLDPIFCACGHSETISLKSQGRSYVVFFSIPDEGYPTMNGGVYDMVVFRRRAHLLAPLMIGDCERVMSAIIME